MATDKKLPRLIINKMNQEQFETVTPSEDELYLVEETKEYATVEELATKQDIISDLDTIRAGASNGATAYTTIQGYGDIVTHNAIEFALKSEIPDVSKLATDSLVVHKAQNETITGVKTFNGGSGGNNVGIKVINGMSIGSTTQTAYSQYATIRLVNGKVNTGSYYIDGNSSVLFRHKTGTATAEGSANDAMFTINPETGIKAGWSGTAGVGITDSDLHDVLIDTVEYSKLTTTAKDVLGAINELNDKTKFYYGGEVDNIKLAQVRINNDDYTKSSFLACHLVNDNPTLDIATNGDYNNSINLNHDGISISSEKSVALVGTVDFTNATVNGLNFVTPIDLTTLLFTLFPVGAIYQGNMDECPLATLMEGTTWELVAQGRVLQGADSSHTRGTNIAQGLPNVTGKIYSFATGGANQNSGALYQTTDNQKCISSASGQQNNNTWRYINLDTSLSSSIYQDGANVQPPAYAVNIWERKS